MARRKNKGNKAHYVDNSVFLEAMIQYKSEYDNAKKNEQDLPQISEYLGSVFLKIAQRLSFRPNFINYTFKNDMISDGIENCLHYIHNFNPDKSTNPFAYFTQIIYYAFIRRIQKEKKQTHIKNKIISGSNYRSYDTMPGDSTSYNISNSFAIGNLPQEDVYKPKKVDNNIKNKKGLENFMETEDKRTIVRGID